jgi:hypothetical protein
VKPYIKRYPQLLAVAGDMRHSAHGAYWVAWEMTDHRGIIRSYKRPFLAIQRDPGDAPLLLEEQTLREIGIDISLREDEKGGNRWYFDVDSDVIPFVKMVSTTKFLKTLINSPKVYSLIAHHVLEDTKSERDSRLDQLLDQFPAQLHGYKDVFSEQNAAILAPNREGIDLAIESQDGKELPYVPLYPLSQAELEVLKKNLQELLHKGFI